MLDGLETEQITLGIILLISVKEFFAYLKVKKIDNSPIEGNLSEVKKDIALIDLQLNNHMTDYNKKLDRTDEKVKNMNKKLETIKDCLIEIRGERLE